MVWGEVHKWYGHVVRMEENELARRILRTRDQYHLIAVRRNHPHGYLGRGTTAQPWHWDEPMFAFCCLEYDDDQFHELGLHRRAWHDAKSRFVEFISERNRENLHHARPVRRQCTLRVRYGAGDPNPGA